MAVNLVALLNWPRGFLATHEIVRLQVLVYLRFISLSVSINQYLGQIYNNHHEHYEHRSERKQHSSASHFVVLAKLGHENDDRLRNATTTATTNAFHIDERLKALADKTLNPKLVLALFKLWDAFRVLTTLWFIYVLIKLQLADNQLIRRLLHLSRPLHCYLAGRLILAAGLSDIVALQFSVLHLSWRLHQALKQSPYRLGIIHFLLLSERELEQVYWQLGAKETIELSMEENERLDALTCQTLETMCYPLRRPMKVIYKLRPNRTRRSHWKLRRLVGTLSYVALIAFVACNCFISYFVWLYVSQQSNYVRLYPGCGPEQSRMGAPNGGGGGLDWHRSFALRMDMMENCLLYVEGGVVFAGIVCMQVLTMDLIRLWTDIRRRVDNLQERVRQEHERRLVPFEQRSIVGRWAPGRRLQEDEVDELIASISDFFQQVAHADEVISTFLVGMLLASLLACAQFTYSARLHDIGRLPAQAALLISFVLVWIVSASYGFLAIHRHCQSAYPKLCSLIANDNAKHRLKFKALLDYYNMHRSCFTLMRHVPFLPTTFFTMIGWTFSCFCIISGLLRDSTRLQRAQAELIT